MPSFNFLNLSLLLFLTTRGRAAETVTYTLPDNDLQKHCSFDLNGYVYDLCPLMGLPQAVEVPEQTSAGSRVWRFGSGRYALALGGLAKENPDLVKMPGLSCNEDTQVCLTSVHEHGFRSTPLLIIQKSTSSNLIISIGSNGNLNHDSSTHLQVAFRGIQDLDVVFICSEVEKVDLISDRDDKLRFMWASRYGCPKISTRRGKSEPDLTTWNEDQDQEHGDDQQGDEELLPSENRRARTGIAFVIVFIVLSVISCSALASSPRARHFIVEHLRTASSIAVPVFSKVGLKLGPIGQSLNSLKSKAVSSVRFRRRDDTLMRWAQEEMALDSDVMVNGSDTYYQVDEESESWEGLSSEYIPLATGSGLGKGRRIQSYGSTHDRVTSHEIGVLSRMKRYLKI